MEWRMILSKVALLLQKAGLSSVLATDVGDTRCGSPSYARRQNKGNNLPKRQTFAAHRASCVSCAPVWRLL